MSIADTRVRICKAATELFARFGYAKTSLEEIAVKAKVGKATIYYHFASKEDLFIEAVSVKAEELFRLLAESIHAAEGFKEKLSVCLTMPMKYIFENLPLFAEALSQISMQYLQRLDNNRDFYKSKMIGMLKEIILEGKTQGIVRDSIDADRFCEVINEWFLMGDTWIDCNEKERIIGRIERDHALIIDIILNGIVTK